MKYIVADKHADAVRFAEDSDFSKWTYLLNAEQLKMINPEGNLIYDITRTKDRSDIFGYAKTKGIKIVTK